MAPSHSKDHLNLVLHCRLRNFQEGHLDWTCQLGWKVFLWEATTILVVRGSWATAGVVCGARAEAASPPPWAQRWPRSQSRPLLRAKGAASTEDWRLGATALCGWADWKSVDPRRIAVDSPTAGSFLSCQLWSRRCSWQVWSPPSWTSCLSRDQANSQATPCLDIQGIPWPFSLPFFLAIS